MKDTLEIQTDNPYQLLTEEEAEQSETSALTTGLPEKWKPVVSRPKQMPNKKVRVASALKAAGQTQGHAAPPVLETTELPSRMTGSGASKLDGLGDGRLLAASRTPSEKSLIDEPVETTVRTLERPYTTSYFLPGKLEGKPVQFLIDTGCTTNLLSKQVFNRLPERVKGYLEESDSHGIMADGTQLPFYGVLRLPLRVRDVKTEATFVVSRINEDAILGMPFLVAHNCSMEFNQPMIQVDGKRLKCTDRHGRLLVSSVQVTRDLVVPPRTEMAVQCRVTTKNFCPIGIIEEHTDGPPVATSLNRPGIQGRVIARCLNLTNQPMRLKAGATIGSFTGVEEKQVDDLQPLTSKIFLRQRETMYQNTWKDCMKQLRIAARDQSSPGG